MKALPGKDQTPASFSSVFCWLYQNSQGSMERGTKVFLGVLCTDRAFCDICLASGEGFLGHLT